MGAQSTSIFAPATRPDRRDNKSLPISLISRCAVDWLNFTVVSSYSVLFIAWRARIFDGGVFGDD
jgi:hypothetical protein